MHHLDRREVNLFNEHPIGRLILPDEVLRLLIGEFELFCFLLLNQVLPFLHKLAKLTAGVVHTFNDE